MDGIIEKVKEVLRKPHLSVGDAVSAMRTIALIGDDDPEVAHILADNLKDTLLRQLDYGAVVEAGKSIPVWCA